MSSLRRKLLVGILAPVLGFVLVNGAILYRQALAAADTAYDRTLLASAKSIGELLAVAGEPGAPQLRAALPYAALEPFEADNRSRMFFRVSGFDGELVSGYEDLPNWRGPLPDQRIYAALVHFHDGAFRGEPVRVAVLLQPVSGHAGQGMATIQVAETLELRQALARQLLIDTLWRQAVLVGLIALVVVFVVDRATRPVRALSAQLEARPEGDLRPLARGRAPRELWPMIDATNALMTRLAQLVEHQKRFVRDAAHQLRTPLAVLKTQQQSALRGDVDPAQALHDMGHTVERATELANQMLALAKVEQLRQQGEAPLTDWGAIVREVAIDLSALIGERRLDFVLDAPPLPVRAHEWALRELTRNLLHNAIRHGLPGSPLTLSLATVSGQAVLTMADGGPGLSAERRALLFQPFASGAPGGSGLGLAICHEIVASLSGSIALDNRLRDGRVEGLDAVVRLPLAPPPRTTT